jgi:hypothetical protein
MVLGNQAPTFCKVLTKNNGVKVGAPEFFAVLATRQKTKRKTSSANTLEKALQIRVAERVTRWKMLVVIGQRQKCRLLVQLKLVPAPERPLGSSLLAAAFALPTRTHDFTNHVHTGLNSPNVLTGFNNVTFRRKKTGHSQTPQKLKTRRTARAKSTQKSERFSPSRKAHARMVIARKNKVKKRINSPPEGDEQRPLDQWRPSGFWSASAAQTGLRLRRIAFGNQKQDFGLLNPVYQ